LAWQIQDLPYLLLPFVTPFLGKPFKIHKSILLRFENFARRQHRFMRDAYSGLRSAQKTTPGKKGGLI
jgi:hypothetical protein